MLRSLSKVTGIAKGLKPAGTTKRLKPAGTAKRLNWPAGSSFESVHFVEVGAPSGQGTYQKKTGFRSAGDPLFRALENG